MFGRTASGVDLGDLSPETAIEAFHSLERKRRQLEAEIAAVVGAVHTKALFTDDGHRSVEGWCRALGRWGRSTARHAHQLARLFRDVPAVQAAADAGAIGIDQLHEMARAAANPRCGDRFGEVAQIFLDLAPKVPHQQFRLGINHWLQLADADGAHHDQEEAHARRRAVVVEHDGVLHVSATGTGLQAAEILEIFEHFCKAEFLTDWNETKEKHGDDATPSLMPRTDAQRRFDALHAIFRAAASTPPGSTPPEPIVNICTTLREFVSTLSATFGTPVDISVDTSENNGADTEALSETDTEDGTNEEPAEDVEEAEGRPESAESDADWVARLLAGDAEFDPRQRVCETLSGFPILRQDLVGAAMLGWVRRVVTDKRGVVLDMGHRARFLRGRRRDAVMLADGRCIWPGCEMPSGRCQIDHLHGRADGGVTSVENSGPMCGYHNRFKNRGFTVMRDADGYWHTYRPDGTEIC